MIPKQREYRQPNSTGQHATIYICPPLKLDSPRQRICFLFIGQLFSASESDSEESEDVDFPDEASEGLEDSEDDDATQAPADSGEEASEELEIEKQAKKLDRKR